MPFPSLLIAGSGNIKQQLPGCKGDKGVKPGVVFFDLGEIVDNELHICGFPGLKKTLEVNGGGGQKIECHVGRIDQPHKTCRIKRKSNHEQLRDGGAELYHPTVAACVRLSTAACALLTH